MNARTVLAALIGLLFAFFVFDLIFGQPDARAMTKRPRIATCDGQRNTKLATERVTTC